MNLLNKLMDLLENSERPPTQFNIETIEQVFNGPADFGRRVTVTINRNGDLIGPRMRIVLPPIDNFINNIIETIDFAMDWSIVYKLITHKNTECPISLEVIKKGDEYCICAQCSYNFSKEELKTHFKTQLKNQQINQQINHNITCPMCRAKWSDQIIYINEDKIEDKV